MNNKNKPTTGFTLFELLVVIAIIAILAAILFPVFASAREKARQATCTSNEKQIGVAMLLYTQDYDEFLPPASYNDPNDPSATPSPTAWMYLVDPYIKSGITQSAKLDAGTSYSVYVCPDYQKTQVGNSPSHSYAVNANLMPSWINDTGYKPADHPSVSTAKIHGPAQLVLLAEAASGSRIFTTGEDDVTVTDSGSGDNDVFWQCQAVYLRGRVRHNNGSNYLFADGHVKWFGAPGTSFTSTGANWYNVAPVPAQSNVVWQQSAYPAAGGWFVEDPTKS